MCAFIAKAVGDRQVRTVASDVPYNVKIAGNVSGTNRFEEFAMASGEMDKPQFTTFLASAIKATQSQLLDGAVLYLFMDWRHIAELIAASEAAKLSFLNLLVWATRNRDNQISPTAIEDIVKKLAAEGLHNEELAREFGPPPR